MARFIARIVITASALLLVAYIVPGIDINGVVPALVGALLLGIVNAIVRPILILLTLPITIITLGLFIFVINATLFLWIGNVVDGFYVESFLHALLGSVLVSIVSSYVSKALK